MLKLKTKTEIQLPSNRVIVVKTLRLIIDQIVTDKNNITAKGYYYFYDANGQIVVLDTINLISLKSDIRNAETAMLPPLKSTIYHFDNEDQRLQEMTMYHLQLEANKNYNTVYTDWIVDTDVINATFTL